MNKLSLPSILIALALVLAACGSASTSLPTPPSVTTLPNPATLSYKQYDPAVIGIVLEPGESRTIQTANDEYFNIFFAGRNGENYVGYISQWNGSLWSEWTEVAITADEAGSFESLNIEAQTRPQDPCFFDACFNEVDWFIVNFDGVGNNKE